MATLTLHIEDRTLAHAHARAAMAGTTLETFLGSQVERLTGAEQRSQEALAYLESTGRGDSRGRSLNRGGLQRYSA